MYVGLYSNLPCHLPLPKDFAQATALSRIGLLSYTSNYFQ